MRETLRKEGPRSQTTQIAGHNIQAFVQTTETGADRLYVLRFRRRDCDPATTTDGVRNSRHQPPYTTKLSRGSSGLSRARLPQLRQKRIRLRHRCQLV